MSIKSRKLFSWMVAALFLVASACQPQSTPAAVVATPVVIATSVPPTEVFLGAIPVSLPADRLDQAGDVDSSANAYKKSAPGGDEFVNNLFERPFNANTMETYFPYLDIVSIRGFRDNTWGYGTITVSNTDKNAGLPGQYALELDLNRDGRGDWLILAKTVGGAEWSTQGVQVWHEPDRDIGGQYAMVSEKIPKGNEGYEDLVFDEGKGDLIDAAWTRISPDDPKTVEMSFKLDMLGNPSAYSMGGWAGTTIDPAMFDYNDYMTHIEAGSPLPGYKVYPLKALAEIDNTCRLAIGFAPTGKEPGLCATVQRRQVEGTGPCVPHRCPITYYDPNCVPVSCP